MTTSAPVSALTTSRRRLRPLIVLAAALSAVAVFVIAVPLLGVDVSVPESPGSDVRAPLEIAAVGMMALISSLLGWLALVVLERLAGPRARTIWTVLALVVLVVSLPYMPGYSATERAVLGLMHLALGAVLIGGMLWTCTSDE